MFSQKFIYVCSIFLFWFAEIWGCVQGVWIEVESFFFRCWAKWGRNLAKQGKKLSTQTTLAVFS